jgi:hypothetical protein
MRNFFTRSTTALAACVTGLSSVTAAAAAEPQFHKIVYRVFGPQTTFIPFGPGPGTLANVSYRTPNIEIHDKLVPLPWNLVFQVQGDEAELASKLRLSLTRPESEQGDGNYACEISVDGEVRSREDGDPQDGGPLQCLLSDS